MRLRKFDRLSRSKSSNVPIRSAALWSCPNAGSSSAPLRGSIAAAAWLKTGSASTERPWHSYASHQFASCSENFAIRPEVSGQTLRVFGTLYFLDGVMGVFTGSGYLDLSIFIDGIRNVSTTVKILSSVPHLGLGAIGIAVGWS